MIFGFIDTYERSMKIKTTDKKQMGAIAGKIFKRKSWSEDAPLRFALYVPILGEPYFAYCNMDGIFKPKTGFGYEHKGHQFSTVGEGVLKSTDIIEIKKAEKMVETINVVGGTITISECAETNVVHKTALETKPKWGAKWYDVKGDHIKSTFYAKKKDALAELKLAPSRTLVLYKMVEVITVDMPLKIEEV